jgi:DNA-binding GntR family transcriptional regulator
VAVSASGELLPHRAFTPEEIEDTLVLREILEMGAARKAADRALSPGERETLWTRLQESREASGTDYRRLDSRLHLTIAELAGSASLVPLVAEVRMRVNELLDGIPSLGPNISHSDEQHERVVAAILTGRSEVAAEAMREHVAGSAALLRGFLN